MRTPIAHAARSLAAFFVLAPAFVACQSPSEDGNDGATNPSARAAETENDGDETPNECAPDETPERVCKDMPDGTVECIVFCVPQAPTPPECDKGTHPVRACKPEAGADEECFILCLPDHQPPPVDPDECGPGTHPEYICEGPTPPWPPTPWPHPVPTPGDPSPVPPDGPHPEPLPYPRGDAGGSTGGGSPGFPGSGPGWPDGPGGECKIVCLPDAPPFPHCPPDTHPEKICRFDPATGNEICSVECLPGGGEPPPVPECPDGSPGHVVCKEVDGKVFCEVICGPVDLPLPLPEPPPPPPQPVPEPEPKP